MKTLKKQWQKSTESQYECRENYQQGTTTERLISCRSTMHT